MDALTKRLIDITYKENLCHLSSCLSSLPIIEEIYTNKQENDIFILSNGHAALALYCVLEKFYGIDAIYLLHKHGVHPSKNIDDKIYCSTGSLGCGLPIAVGHALSDRTKNVWCLISDGECAEGSIWESLAFAYKSNLNNLKIYVNINGMAAYEYIDVCNLKNRLLAFFPDIMIRESPVPEYTFASGLLSHYYILKKEDYEKL